MSASSVADGLVLHFVGPGFRKRPGVPVLHFVDHLETFCSAGLCPLVQVRLRLAEEPPLRCLVVLQVRESILVVLAQDSSLFFLCLFVRLVETEKILDGLLVQLYWLRPITLCSGLQARVLFVGSIISRSISFCRSLWWLQVNLLVPDRLQDVVHLAPQLWQISPSIALASTMLTRSFAASVRLLPLSLLRMIPGSIRMLSFASSLVRRLPLFLVPAWVSALIPASLSLSLLSLLSAFSLIASHFLLSTISYLLNSI